MADENGGVGQILNRLDNLNTAVNNLSETMKLVFPQGNTTAVTAGGSSGQYFVVQLPDGTTRKIALLLP